jgi:hypothetical protein
LNNGGGGFHSADRFLSQEEGAFTGAFTISNDSDSPKGFSNSTKWDCTTADTSLAAADSIFVDYKPEAQDLQHLNYGTPDALQMTASFWIKSNKTGTYVLWLYQYDDGRQVSAPYTINSADTWEYKTLLIPADPTGVIDNNNGAGLVLRFVMGSGSNQSSGTTPSAWESLVEANRYAGQTVNLADSTSNYMNITGIQLEIGEVATPFEYRSYGEELALCQRYYYKINSAENNANYQRFAMVNIETSTEAEALFIHPVTMRAIPTLETTAVSGFHIFSANAVSVVSGMAIDQASPHSVGVALTASGGGLTGGYVGLLDANNNKTAQLAFNAEL